MFQLSPRWHKVGPLYEPSHVGQRQRPGAPETTRTGFRRKSLNKSEGSHETGIHCVPSPRRDGISAGPCVTSGFANFDMIRLAGPQLVALEDTLNGVPNGEENVAWIPSMQHTYAKRGMMQHHPGKHWFQRGDSSRNDAAVVAADKQLGNRGAFHLYRKDRARARRQNINVHPGPGN